MIHCAHPSRWPGWLTCGRCQADFTLDADDLARACPAGDQPCRCEGDELDRLIAGPRVVPLIPTIHLDDLTGEDLPGERFLAGPPLG